MRQRAPTSNRASDVPDEKPASTRSVATTSATSGVVSSPPSPTTSTGSPASRSASASTGICARRRTSTAAVRAPGGSASHAALVRPASQRASSRWVSVNAISRVPSPALGPGRNLPSECRGAQRRGDGIRGGEDATVVAEAGRERIHRRWRAVGAAERAGEHLDVAGARASPAVDRLERVAHRGDSVAVAEQAVQHGDLGVAGVLVFVEQHGAVARPLDGAHLVEAGQPRGQPHLVAEVDSGQRGLGRGELGDQRKQRTTVRRRTQEGGDVAGLGQLAWAVRRPARRRPRRTHRPRRRRRGGRRAGRP